jgi:hypothetical protein
MMEIRVMIGFNFYNEDSEIVRFEDIKDEKYTETLPDKGEVEKSRLVNEYKEGSQTTLSAMYADGWVLKQVINTQVAYRVMLFLER